MLQKLHIQNYAIIDEVEIHFLNQLNVITGETGAGKSILMGALSLILGQRVETSVLRNRDKKCVVEGYFVVEDKQAIQQFFASNELDFERELVVRREIAVSGKSRSFINDTPASLQQIKELASLLVDLHQQFDTLEIGDSDFQREIIDAIAANTDLLAQYQLHFSQYQKTTRQLDELKQQKTSFNKDFDYHQYLYAELNELKLAENELEELEAELNLLSNAEAIKTALTAAYFQLKEQEQPIVIQLKTLANQVRNYSDYHQGLPAIAERLLSTQIELQDIADEIDRINDGVQFDEQRIAVINDRLSAGYKLLKKHGLQTTNQLLELQAELEAKLKDVLQIDDKIAAAEQEAKLLQQQALTVAQKISVNRKKVAAPLAEKVNGLLAKVGMPNGRLQVQVNEKGLSTFGIDEIEFLFDANKSNRFEPVRKVASGGELSRLMLCIKSLVAQTIDLPTLIFDEIDTGISGEAARQVGLIMKELAASRQVICITHQPQIAGKADAHFFVYKEAKAEGIKTGIRLLSQDERINSIAQMLGGEKPTAAALENAREMVLSTD